MSIVTEYAALNVTEQKVERCRSPALKREYASYIMRCFIALLDKQIVKSVYRSECVQIVLEIIILVSLNSSFE